MPGLVKWYHSTVDILHTLSGSQFNVVSQSSYADPPEETFWYLPFTIINKKASTFYAEAFLLMQLILLE